MMDSNLTAYSKQVYGPFYQEYCLAAEYNLLNFHPIPGMYVIPSASSPLKWYGVLFVRHGVYQGAVCRFILHIPEHYPDDNCPNVVLEKPYLFHPLVDADTGDVDVRRGFRKWRQNVNHLWQVLQYLRRIFVKVETDSPLNQEAARLFLQSPDEFRETVQNQILTIREAALQELEEEADEEEVQEPAAAAEYEDTGGTARTDEERVEQDKPEDHRCEIKFNAVDEITHNEALEVMLTDPFLTCFESPPEIVLFDEAVPQAATGYGYSWMHRDTMLILGREEGEDVIE